MWKQYFVLASGASFFYLFHCTFFLGLSRVKFFCSCHTVFPDILLLLPNFPAKALEQVCFFYELHSFEELFFFFQLPNISSFYHPFNLGKTDSGFHSTFSRCQVCLFFRGANQLFDNLCLFSVMSDFPFCKTNMGQETL